MPINNFDLIKPLLKFDSDDEFYFLTVVLLNFSDIRGWFNKFNKVSVQGKK